MSGGDAIARRALIQGAVGAGAAQARAEGLSVGRGHLGAPERRE
jgi:hypothetical protein